jgi:predicted lipoprotein with Yx(FWY)xxD motif
MKLLILPLLALLAAGLVAACGGSSSSSDNASSSSASTPASSGGGAYGAAAPQSTPAAKSGAVSVMTGKGDPGTFLVDSSGRALYLWEADKGTQSMCSGACADSWPPLTTKGKPTAGKGVQASLLATTKRSDGSLEVTYAGHPLYYYAGDASPGQTTGQGNDGFGAKWYVVSPAGKAIDSD